MHYHGLVVEHMGCVTPLSSRAIRVHFYEQEGYDGMVLPLYGQLTPF
jgi:hypothetical protein